MQANGAGKSFAFSSLGEILYEEPIVGLKEDTVKEGERGITLKIKDRKVEVIRKNTKLDIIVDGKPKAFRRKPDAQAWLRKHLPMSHHEFNTYGYLDSRVPHPLVMGSSSERKKFFTEAFGLHKIDVERRIFEAELSALKRTRAAYKELRAVFDAEREKALPKEKRLALEEKVRAYEEELDDLNRKNMRLQTIGQLLAFETSAAKKIEAFNRVVPDLAEFTQVYKDARLNLKEDKEKLADARAWQDYQRDSRKYDKAVASLSEGAAKLVARLGVKKALKICRKAAEVLDELREKRQRFRDLEENRVQKPEAPAEDRPSESKKELRARLESVEHRLEHAERFGSGKCDSCGQDVKIKDPKVLRKKLKALQADLDLHEQWDDYEDAYESYKKWSTEFKAIGVDMPEVSRDIEFAKDQKAWGKEIRDLPEEPEPFTGKKLEVEVCERMVEEDRQRIELLEFMEPNLETIKSLRELTDKQRAASSKGPMLQARINEIHERVSKIKARLEVNQMVTSSLKKHRDRLLEMKAELAEEESLRLLVEAYSDKNMKRMAVKAVSTRLMKEVNRIAKVIFPEDFEFGFSWESSKISLTVTRKYREGRKIKTKTTDVRKLSGAESKLYTFILVFAHLKFVPQHKRSNVLILDEPDAAFSAETTEAFKKLLPILGRVIPSIVVITPRTAERYHGATEYTVVKEKGESRMVLGHPSTIK
jgi:DNA repair exonuclease SbcCD ATPase subunit